MTALRLADVKMSAIFGPAVLCCEPATVSRLIREGNAYSVVDSRPGRIARIHFFVEKLAIVMAPPRLGSETFQHAWPTVLRVVVPVGVQTGKQIGESAPSADEIRFRELFGLYIKAVPSRVPGSLLAHQSLLKFFVNRSVRENRNSHDELFDFYRVIELPFTVEVLL